MADDQIRYDVLTQDALRGVIRTVLERVANDGLPGEHHFYVAFDTRADGVAISKRLREQYPDEMTIVLQYQFWDLEVGDDRFEVKLSFNNVPERLVVPFTAIKAFFDPSVQFGLQFSAQGAANDTARLAGTLPGVVGQAEGEALPVAMEAGDDDLGADAHDEPASRRAAEIVELDAFRKK